MLHFICPGDQGLRKRNRKRKKGAHTVPPHSKLFLGLRKRERKRVE